jgi:hypothetical protein
MVGQQRVLEFCLCLTCRRDRSPTMQGAVRDFAAVIRERLTACVLPTWE